ncbi:hypothetical protein [Fluviicola sp.]|uniref:hypothetical protein n=1 Tax=Fluviicola sp. TaxID=1917219 RepID=UPI0026052EE2|nr:hypothetical protein [Fluviicola sp.]
MTRLFSILILLTITIACKKEAKTKQKLTPYEDHLAPCPLDFYNYQLDSVFSGPSGSFPNAVYRIKFSDTTDQNQYLTPHDIELAFNVIPTTGVYFLTEVINPSSETNQMAFKMRFGAYGVKSLPNEPKSVYVEANSDYLIVSFCNQSVRVTNLQWTGNLGEHTESMKVKKKF